MGQEIIHQIRKVLIDQGDQIPDKRSLDGSIGLDSGQGKPQITRQSKFKREPSNKDGCKENSPLCDETRLIARCKFDKEITLYLEVKLDSGNCPNLVLFIYVI